MAVPLFRQVANVLRAEGYLFTVFTPGGSVRLMSDRAPRTTSSSSLDTTGEQPTCIGRVSRARAAGSIESERPIAERPSAS